MAIVELVMPKLGESIMEATILKWHKKPGEVVALDEIVNEIIKQESAYNLTTDDGIGHTFWVPRSINEYITTEELQYEGETWHRKVFEFRGYAKQKRIIAMEIKMYDSNVPIVMCGCENVDDQQTDLLQWYPEHQISNHSEEEALKIAEE